MRLNEAIKQYSGLKYIVDSLELLSSPGRQLLLGQEMNVDPQSIRKSLDEIRLFSEWRNCEENKKYAQRLENAVMRLRDISFTLENLSKGNVIDDIELFEIKSLALLSEDIRRITTEGNLDLFSFPELNKVVEILDPENTHTPYFYIYDAYSPELGDIRKRLKVTEVDTPEAASLFAEAVEIENTIRKELSQKLRIYASDLKRMLNLVASLDIVIAKVKLNQKEGLSCPEITLEEKTEWKGLFNPAVKESLRLQNKVYQPIDFDVVEGVSLVTGANMGGKSVLLKTLALGQLMVQFGFFVPASHAVVSPVEEIYLCTGDSQSEFSGLSSFAAEIIKINEAVLAVRKNERLLVLIDEPARTTNPEEGRAITSSLLEFFSRRKALAVITSHYSGLKASRRLRVKGLSGRDLPENADARDISSLMDYSLEEDSGLIPPREAIRVAGILGVDPEILEGAKKCL